MWVSFANKGAARTQVSPSAPQVASSPPSSGLLTEATLPAGRVVGCVLVAKRVSEA